jgi:hypothetical protein
VKTIASTLFTSLLVLGLSACGGKSKPPTEPAPTTGDPASGAPTPTTAEECEAAGYTVVGDIGDGQVKCPDGTTEISHIKYGIEGGVCCDGGAGESMPVESEQGAE